jgi:signal transduction histidine kinase
MFLFFSVLTTVIAVAIFFAGLLAFLRNPKKSQNRWFLGFTISIALWIPFNFIDSNVVHAFWTNFFLKLDFSMALFIAWGLLEFVKVFSVRFITKQKNKSLANKFRIFTLLANIVFCAFILGGLVISSSIVNGKFTVHYSSGFIAYVVLLLFYFIYAFGRLFYKRMHAPASDRPAFNFIFGGLLAAVVANLLTNLVFPLVITNQPVVKELNAIGYLGLLIFVVFVYLAITTQKLFDIRSFVVRTLAYLVIFFITGLLYVTPVVFLTTYVLHTPLKLSTTISLVLITFLIALLFQPLKTRFNRVTNKAFFRDYYDSRDVLDQISELLVGSFEVEHIKTGTANIIVNAMKSRSVHFKLLQDTNNEDKPLLNALMDSKRDVVITDELDQHRSIKLHEILSASDVALAVRLRTTHEDLGYIVIGYKQSGSVYNKNDRRLLSVISDEVAIGLQNALRFKEIQNFNTTLQQKVDDATRKLRRANEKLKALDETKDDFISMASHQLRTPLTSVKGYISMVLEQDAGKITHMQREMLGQAFFSSQRMVYLIADLLNVSRLRTGKFIIETTPVNLAEVVEQELEQLKETAAARSLVLSYKKPKHFPDLMLDETKTRQVIMNFADNAIYYTPSGGHITVRLVDTPTVVELRVEDDGIGVPKSEQAHLFTKFYRAGNARKARPDGTGLGLFMAKKVVIAQGGALIFESQEGKGSTFGFVFSKAKLAVPVKLPAQA